MRPIPLNHEKLEMFIQHYIQSIKLVTFDFIHNTGCIVHCQHHTRISYNLHYIYSYALQPKPHFNNCLSSKSQREKLAQRCARNYLKCDIDEFQSNHHHIMTQSTIERFSIVHLFIFLKTLFAQCIHKETPKWHKTVINECLFKNSKNNILNW